MYKITDECVACGTCMDECEHDAIKEGDIYEIDQDACQECGNCIDAFAPATLLSKNNLHKTPRSSRVLSVYE